jgi:hypothetical protein
VAAAFEPPELAGASGLDVDTAGAGDRHPDEHDQPRIVGAGDAVVLTERPLRMGCHAATPKLAITPTHTAKVALIKPIRIDNRDNRVSR